MRLSPFRVVAILVCAPVVPPAAADIISDLAVHYEFNDASPAADLGFNSVTGVTDAVNGSSLTQVTGPGGAVSNGATFQSSRLDVNSGSVVPALSNGTLSASAWFRTTHASSRSIINIGNASHSDDLFILELISGRPSIFLRETGSTGDTSLLHSTALNDNAWHFVAFTWDGGTNDILSLYVDGLLSQQSTISGTAGIDATHAAVGNRWANGNTPFNGDIADVRVYSRSLTTSDIGELYSLSTAAVPEPSTFVLLGIGGLAGLRMRRRKQ